MVTVLVTGAGGEYTPSLIEHLQGLGYRVVAVDARPCTVGGVLADATYKVPLGGSPCFAIALEMICLCERVQAVIPLVDEELLAAADLESKGIAVIAPRAEAIRACRDKLTLMRRLAAGRVPVPRTRPAGLICRFPAVAKPRTGRGSRDVTVLRGRRDHLRWLATNLFRLRRYLFQDYIDGPEYTVSVVCWRDGRVRAVVPKETLLRQVSTRIGVTRWNGTIDAVCRRIQDVLRLDGPFNVQLRLDRHGNPRVFEVNPRFSGSSPLTLAAGVDEVGGLVAEALGQPVEWPKHQTGVVMLRRAKDVFLTEDEFAKKGWPYADLG